jgi:hypothetical protein
MDIPLSQVVDRRTVIVIATLLQFTNSSGRWRAVLASDVPSEVDAAGFGVSVGVPRIRIRAFRTPDQPQPVITDPRDDIVFFNMPASRKLACQRRRSGVVLIARITAGPTPFRRTPGRTRGGDTNPRNRILRSPCPRSIYRGFVRGRDPVR